MMMRKLFVVVGFILLVLVMMRFGGHDLVASIVTLGWTLVPVLMLYGGHQAARAFALMWCVRTRAHVTFGDSLAVRLSGEAVEALTFTGPMLSEPTKGWLLRGTGLGRSEGLAATLFEFVGCMMAGAAMAAVGAGYVLVVLHPPGPAVAVLRAVLGSASGFLAAAVISLATRARLASTLAYRFLRYRPAGLVALEDAFLATAQQQPLRLAAILAAECVAQAFLVCELWVLVSGLHLQISIERAIVVEGIVKFLNAIVFFVPGQLGVAEGSYAIVFGLLGLPPAAGVALSLARRFRSLVTGIVGAAVFASIRPRHKDGCRLAASAEGD
jgi:hypothetical protein